MVTCLSFEDIRAAAGRIRPYIHKTPVMTSRAIDEIAGARLCFKCENLQRVGAFKVRGATNAVFSFSGDEASRGVTTHSSGNHAAALAQAARWRGIKASVVMPDNAPAVKKAAVAGYGAEIVFCEPTLKAREEGVARIIERTGASFVHPYDNLEVIAGQATMGLELHEQVMAPLDAVVVPVGGGGLLAGLSLAHHHLSAETRVYGAEPESVDDAYQSLKAGRIMPVPSEKATIADGLLTELGQLNFPIIQEHAEGILTVDEDGIVNAMRLIWERMKLVVEPSAAVALASVLANKRRFSGQGVGVVLSGGNVDLGRLPWTGTG